MSDQRDFYEILGVDRAADARAIKSAYRNLAKQFHPDRNPGDAEAEHKFKEATLAYEILKDDQKRAAYDQYGHAAFAQGGGGRPGGFEFNFGGGFADLFEEMFGGDFGFGGQRQQARNRGADIRYDLALSLEEAFRGIEPEITVATLQACESCGGSGAAEGAQPITCATCGGAGRVRATQGFFTVQRTCHTCGGVGKVIDNPCKPCKGAGRVRREKMVNVSIPPGVEDGTRLRVPGEGEAGLQGGPAGDLYVFLTLEPHPLFQREREDLYCRTPIPMVMAALGGDIEVPLIDGGKAKVSIPAGAQSGSQFRLRGKGMSILNSGHRGNMYVEAVVETPVHLTRKQKDLLKEFAADGKPHKTNPEHHGFLARVKSFWESLAD